MPPQESYLVIGGCGFLGQHIVGALLDRGETSVAVLDNVQGDLPSVVQFFQGDIVNQPDVENAICKVSGWCSNKHEWYAPPL